MSSDARIALFGVLIGIALSLVPMLLIGQLESEKRSANMYQGLALEAQANFESSSNMVADIIRSRICAEIVDRVRHHQCKNVLVPLDDGAWKSATASAGFDVSNDRDLIHSLRRVYDNVYATNREEDEVASFEYLQDVRIDYYQRVGNYDNDMVVQLKQDITVLRDIEPSLKVEVSKYDACGRQHA